MLRYAPALCTVFKLCQLLSCSDDSLSSPVIFIIATLPVQMTSRVGVASSLYGQKLPYMVAGISGSSPRWEWPAWNHATVSACRQTEANASYINSDSKLKRLNITRRGAVKSPLSLQLDRNTRNLHRLKKQDGEDHFWKHRWVINQVNYANSSFLCPCTVVLYIWLVLIWKLNKNRFEDQFIGVVAFIKPNIKKSTL